MNIINYIPVTISVITLFSIIVYIVKNKTSKIHDKEKNINNFIYYMWLLILTVIFLIIFSIMRNKDIQVALPIFISALSLLVSGINYIYNKERLFIGEVNFDTAEILNIEIGDKSTIFSIDLIDSHPQVNFGHYIEPKEIIVSFYYNKTIFEHEECFNKIDNKYSTYYISFNVDTNNINKEKTKFINNSLRFSFDVKDNKNQTKNIFNKDFFYDDTNMLVVEISYKIKRPKTLASFLNIKEKLYTHKLHFKMNDIKEYKYVYEKK